MNIFRFSLLLALAAPLASSPGSHAQELKVSKDNRTLSVTANDHAESDPDVADVHVGFTAYGQDLAAAYRSGSDLSAAVMAALEKAGAAKTSIQSRTQRVERLDDAQTKVLKGMRYSVTQSWIVSVDPKNAATVLDAAVQAGANDSGQIDWRLKNSVALDAEAIRRATIRAKAMAESLAAASGVTLGAPVYLTNNVSGDSPLNGRARAMFNSVSPGVMGYADQKTAPLSVEPQRVDRTATVGMIFAIQ